MGQLISVRTNTDFSVEYETGKLHPQTEVIILVQEPLYKRKGDKIIKDQKLTEIRFKCAGESINHLIGKLQLASNTNNHFEQMAGVLNEIIKSAKPAEEVKKI